MAIWFRPLELAAGNARTVLVLGVVAGMAVPTLAERMVPWIGICIGALLFLAMLRIGPQKAREAVLHLRFSVISILLLQCLLPFSVAMLAYVSGWLSIPVILATVLLLAAPPLSGSPHITVMTGHNPIPALRQLVTGTALLPITTIPVFWLTPALGTQFEVFVVALKLLALITAAAGAAFLLRITVLKRPDPQTERSIDGISAIAMALVVIGLMSRAGVALREQPLSFSLTLALACALNFGAQIAMALLVGKREGAATPALAITAGNRNMALFISVLPAATTDQLLLFIGCCQIPIYLTPLCMKPFYRRFER